MVCNRATRNEHCPPKAVNLCDQLDRDFDITAVPLQGSEFRFLSRQWLEQFCPNVRRQTGKWVFHGFRWHAYSFGHESAVSGTEAFDRYTSQPLEGFLLYHESQDLMFDCDCTKWPDIRPWAADVYIFPRSLQWTFITTHEMTLGLGPYFALPSVADLVD